MCLEEELSIFNGNYFFREFVYSTSKFNPSPGQEVELADNIVSLDEIMLVFQLKERAINTGMSAPEVEEKWFKRKILDKAVEQIKSTVNYLNTHHRIDLTNQKGHRVSISKEDVKHFYKIIVYSGGELDCTRYSGKKFHNSKDGAVGIIHILSAKEYQVITQTLVTLAEVSEYLRFREELIQQWPENLLTGLPETALIGQFVAGEGSYEEQPDSKFTQKFHDLISRQEEWNITGILHHFEKRMIYSPPDQPTTYYPIIKEIAKLKREELRLFKERYILAQKAAQSSKAVAPYRFVASTQYGFIFIVCPEEELLQREIGLENFTYAHKYECKLDKCIGAIFFRDKEEGWYNINWLYKYSPWEENPEMEKNLTSYNNPLRPVSAKQVPAYEFIEKIW